jgi:5-methyltetrahydrofolate--homocysteine methyltransferase
LVGGAALSDKFTRLKIAPQYQTAVCYAKDAMTGLRIMNELSDPKRRAAVLQEHTFTATVAVEDAAPRPQAPAGEERSAKVRTDVAIPSPAYLERKVRAVPDLNDVWSYVNPYMLFGRHLGFRGNFEKALGERDTRALELFNSMEEIKRQARKFMKIGAVWQFFEAERQGNSIALFAPKGASPVHTFHFQRQRVGDKLCLSDYILPALDGQRDHLALFVVTAGEGIREKSEEAKAAGEYLFSHGLQALALETAEACAEWLHRRIREDWGFPDPPALSMAERFTSRYRGKRYSFGYPACPNLEDQAGIWVLLHPEDVGVHLTEGMMMDPEASVSALAFHHPDCNYFSVGDLPEQQPES